LRSANGGPSGGHEVDFFRKASDGTPNFVAYLYDGVAGRVDRFEYSPVAGGPPNILNQDAIATDVSAFVAAFHEASSLPGIVGGANVKPVHIYYGSASWAGGNGIVRSASPPVEAARRSNISMSILCHVLRRRMFPYSSRLVLRRRHHRRVLVQFWLPSS